MSGDDGMMYAGDNGYILITFIHNSDYFNKSLSRGTTVQARVQPYRSGCMHAHAYKVVYIE